MPIKKLNTIDADTLQSIPYEPLSFVVEDLLPQGLHLLAGAPKIGKSWLALWLCLRVARRANRSGTSPHSRAKSSTSAWRTASSASRAGSSISPRTRPRRCTSP